MKLDRTKKLLMWTILIIALIQMPSLALTPAINQIQMHAFPDKSLGQVQSALAFTSLVSPLASIIAGFFINRGIFTKKGVVVTGLLVLALTGFLAILMHTQYWHVIFLSATLGIATGLFMPNAFGLMFDNFTNSQRQAIAGYQTSCINLGGISMGLLGGVLASTMWYGGYLILLVGLPVAILAFITVPHYKSPSGTHSPDAQAKSRLNPRVFYYSAVAFIFMMLYGVGSANISTHIHQNIPTVNDAAMAGIAVAVQMGGGVISGLFFGRLSEKWGDMVLVAACGLVFVGFGILSLFGTVLPVIFIGVFIAGMSLSMALPRCVFAVSTLVDKTTSATATVIVSSIAPSLGGFVSPWVFTRLESKILGTATALRYGLVAVVILILGLVVTFVTRRRQAGTAAAR